jgi:XTP/dITP diphosphohydrolase
MDASLMIDGLCKQDSPNPKQFPGALIKDVFGSMGDKNITDLVAMTWDPNCLWRSVLGYYDGSEAHYFDATVAGKIADSPRGTNGYDWDTIFMPVGQDRTFAEMEPPEKQTYALTKTLYAKFAQFLS